MIRCAIYTRSAVDANHNTQRELVKDFVDNMGWHCLPDRYADNGYSGTDLDRPALQRLLRDVQDDKIDHVVVCDISRLGRSALDQQTIMEIFEQHGVTLVFVDRGTDR